MDNKTLTFTFFTLLLSYTVSAARPTACPPVTNPTAATNAAKISGESIPSDGGSKILLPGEKGISGETIGDVNLHPEPEKIRNNDLPTRTNFSRFHPINRHFQGRPHRGPQQAGTRRPCVKQTQHMVPRAEVAPGKDEIATERTNNPKSRTFRGEVPTNWLKVKHHYGSRHQHTNNNCNHNNNNNKNNNSNNNNNHGNNKDNKEHRDKNEENVIKRKNVFDQEKMKSLKHQQKLKKSDSKSGLMKNIRKFLKHTFD